MRGQKVVREQSEDGQSILWPFSQPGPLGQSENGQSILWPYSQRGPLGVTIVLKHCWIVFKIFQLYKFVLFVFFFFFITLKL